MLNTVHQLFKHNTLSLHFHHNTVYIYNSLILQAKRYCFVIQVKVLLHLLHLHASASCEGYSSNYVLQGCETSAQVFVTNLSKTTNILPVYTKVTWTKSSPLLTKAHGTCNYVTGCSQFIKTCLDAGRLPRLQHHLLAYLPSDCALFVIQQPTAAR